MLNIPIETINLNDCFNIETYKHGAVEKTFQFLNIVQFQFIRFFLYYFIYRNAKITKQKINSNLICLTSINEIIYLQFCYKSKRN